jgi:hypothetical protein
MRVGYILHALQILLNGSLLTESALYFPHGCVGQGCCIHGRGQDDQLRMSDYGKGKMPIDMEEVRMAVYYREYDPGLIRI